MTPSTSVGPFHGPVFIVGMPRSGTKLLRDLLNNHSQVAITHFESGCLPHFYHQQDRYGDLAQEDQFNQFFDEFAETSFYKRLMETETYLTRENWQQALTGSTLADAIATFYRLYARAQQKQLWGDKTPLYLLQLPLLKDMFPEARFIHLIRDARDYCLSVKRSWGNNMFLAAQRWTNGIQQCRSDARELAAGDYLELHYEELLDQPEESLKAVCKLLDIPFEEPMLRLTRPTENVGAARDYVGILSSNHGKWKSGLSKGEIRKIERICTDMLRELNYEVSYSGKQQPLSWGHTTWYRVLDRLNYIRFLLRHHNLRLTLLYFLKRGMHRVNRTAGKTKQTNS